VFFTGDWPGAAIVTAIGVGAMVGLSLLGTLIANTGDRGGELFGQIFLNVAMAAGGSAGLDGGFDGDVSFRPLTLTLVGYGAMAFFFVRRLRARGAVTLPALGLQAGRLGVVHAGALLVVALLSYIGGGRFAVRADVITTLFFGTLTLAIALFVAAFIALPNLVPGKVEHYRTLLAGPVRATLFLTVTACAAFGVAFVILAVIDGELTDRPVDFVRGVLALILLMLPNVAGFGMLLGMGVPITIGASGFGTEVDESFTILDAVDGAPQMWIVPVIALGLLVATGWYSARHSPTAANGRPVGWWLAAVLPVALFVLALNVSMSGALGSSGLGEFSFGGDFDLLFVLLLGGVYGIGAGMLGTVMVPRRAPAYPPGYGAYPPAYGAYPPGYPPTTPMPPMVYPPAPPAAPMPPAPAPPTTLTPPPANPPD
jgi:hypothetical protein